MTRVLAVLLLLTSCSALASDSWPDGKELSGRLKNLANNDRSTLHEIGYSAAGQKIRLLEIAPENKAKDGPAVLVIGNAEGDLPLASLTAVELGAAVLAAPAGATAGSVRWYIVAMTSPDGLDRYFARPRQEGGFNAFPVDEDNDGFEGEDPAEDLDKNGLITWMLVEDPAGQWTLNESGLPMKADAARGVPGQYRREIEGHDNDGDGRFNEDPPGGVTISHNFPHGFQAWTDRGGRWPGDQPESQAILEFSFAHPDIALVLVLGRSNNLQTVPEAATPEDLSTMVKVGWRLARSLGLRSGAEYPLSAVLAATEERGARANLTPAQVRSKLHLKPPTNPPAEDIVWWQALADQYQAFLVEHRLDAPRLKAPAVPPGSPASWAYFQLGVPAVAVDLWTLPAPLDTATVDSTVTLPAVGPVPDPELEILQRRTAETQHAGWRPWTPVTLPDGTAALVGGPEPGASTTPSAYAAESRARALQPFFLDLPTWIPRLEMAPLAITDRGEGLFEVEATILNRGKLPYPTTMGGITRRPPPLVVTLDGGEPLQDSARRVAGPLPAGGAVTLRWLVRGNKAGDITVTASAPSLGTITVKGGQR